MTELVTYLNTPSLKVALLAEIEQHEQADLIVKGTYGQLNGVWHGCAIGCSLRSLNILQHQRDPNVNTNVHARYVTELGLPLWLAYLEDNVFERLPDDLARTWPRRFAEAIPVGTTVDDLVLAKILRWVLADETFGVRAAVADATIRGSVDGVIAGFDAEIATGGHATAEQREAAARDARAARDAWDAWAAWAAWAAWDAWAAWAAWDARAARDAWAAWDAWAARAAWYAWDAYSDGKKADAFFPSLSDYVLTLLRALPVTAAVSR
jgi:hypothetical protein